MGWMRVRRRFATLLGETPEWMSAGLVGRNVVEERCCYFIAYGDRITLQARECGPRV